MYIPTIKMVTNHVCVYRRRIHCIFPCKFIVCIVAITGTLIVRFTSTPKENMARKLKYKIVMDIMESLRNILKNFLNIQKKKKKKKRN
jgi:hypothetical protein